jgi:hypothetical protein
MSRAYVWNGHCKKQSDEATQTLLIELHCEPVIGRVRATRWLTMTCNITLLPASIR